MTKKELRKEVHDFCSAFMYEFLRQEIGLVPSLDSYIRKIAWGDTVLDFFSADELQREFLIYSGLSESVFDELDMEFPNDFMTEIASGSEEGMLRWLADNIEKLCRDKGVVRVWIAERILSGWVVVLDSMGFRKEDVLEWLAKKDVEVNKNRMYLFKMGERPSSRDDKWIDWLGVLSLWRTKAVEVYFVEEEEEVSEGIVVRIKDLLNELNEAITIDALYRGTYQYMKSQPGQEDRIWKAEVLRANVRGLTFEPDWRKGILLIKAEVKSETESKAYGVEIEVFDMEFSDKFDEWMPVKAIDKRTHEEFYMRFIEVYDEVKVKCGCQDFQCRFARVLKSMDALIGDVRCPPRKTDRKSINVARVAGACKHILAVLEILSDLTVLRTRVQPSRKVIDLVKGVWIRV
jgi:hypothetical protein